MTKWNTARFLLLLLGLALLTQFAPAKPDRPAPGESARTQVIVLVPDKVPTFANATLEVGLYEFDPRVKGRETPIELHVEKGFRHNQGAQTAARITLGAAVLKKPNMHYFVTVDVIGANGKRTHLGEKEGKRGMVEVLGDGNANQAPLILRPARPHDIVMDIAEEIKKGNDSKATKLAKARAKDFEELIDVEDLYRRRNKVGMGWGSTPGINPAQDSLEIKLIALTRGVPANFNQDAKNNEEAAYWIAALGTLMKEKPEFRPMGKKTKDDWNKKADQMRAAADGFIVAVQAQNLPAVKNSAQKLLTTCSDCHTIYRD